MKNTCGNLIPFPTENHEEKTHCSICGKASRKEQYEIFGKVRTVTIACQCEIDRLHADIQEAQDRQSKRLIEQKFSISELGKRFEECKFDSFIGRPGTEKALESSLDYASSFDNKQEIGLILFGEPGNGKSHLAAAIAHEVKIKGYTVVFQTMAELLDRIRNTFNSKEKETEKEIMTALLECDLLVLDDIGAERISDWVLEKMFLIIDGRYRRKKPIVYTSNYSLKELMDCFTPKNVSKDDKVKANRIISRMLGSSTIVENKASDYRLEEATRRFREQQ